MLANRFDGAGYFKNSFAVITASRESRLALPAVEPSTQCNDLHFSKKVIVGVSLGISEDLARMVWLFVAAFEQVNQIFRQGNRATFVCLCANPTSSLRRI
jgi:hypothetical protein